MTRIVLHIDRVVLNGYAAQDRLAIVDGLREELARHYALPDARRALQNRSNVERVDGLRVSVGGAANPRAIGQHAARGVAGGLSR
jgi:hypothetical protein